MKSRIKNTLIVASTGMLAVSLLACGASPSQGPVEGGEDVIIKSFEVSGTNGALATFDTPAPISLKQGSRFRANWSTSSVYPTFGTLYLSRTPNPDDDRNAQQIFMTNCVFSGSCNWNAETVCSVDSDNSVTCAEKQNTVTKPDPVTIRGFQGEVYLVLEACIVLGCKTEARKISIL